MPDVSEIPEIPEVSTEAQRRALDSMSEELVQKLNLMIEEQDARVKEFAVQNPSLSSLPVTPGPIALPQVPPQPQGRSVPEPPAAPPAVERKLDEYDRQWAREKRGQQLQNPPVPSPGRSKPKHRRQVSPNPEEKQGSNIGSWIFFIVVVLIILRACSEA